MLQDNIMRFAKSSAIYNLQNHRNKRMAKLCPCCIDFLSRNKWYMKLICQEPEMSQKTERSQKGR